MTEPPPTVAPSKFGVNFQSTTNQLAKEESKQVMKPVQPQQQPGDQGQGDGKPKLKRKSIIKEKHRKGKPGKIHIRLPSIEAYEKDLCFAAEAPGRVVVRLERLMGSDKIRPVDGKFMETLLLRLEEEETIAWNRKIRLRKKAEKERHRQLAINGLMEPGPGMEDLYDHPVFRVNRILNRLSSLDHTFTNLALKLPPIDKIDPFDKDESGAFFKEYPFHRTLRKDWEQWKKNHPEKEKKEEIGPDAKNVQDFVAKSTKASRTGLAPKKTTRTGLASGASKPPVTQIPDRAPATSQAPTAARSKHGVHSKVARNPPSDIEEEDEYDEELEDGNLDIPQPPSTVETEVKSSVPTSAKIKQMSDDVNRDMQASLTALQKKYSVQNYDGFEDDWKPYRSELVDKLYTDFDGMENMYNTARTIFDLYTKQELATQAHVKRVVAKSNKSKMQQQQKPQSSNKRQVSFSESASKAAAPSTDEEEELMYDGEWAGESASDIYPVAKSAGGGQEDGEMNLELSASETASSVGEGEMETLSSRQMDEEPFSSSIAENSEEEEEEETAEVDSEAPALTPLETDVEEEEEAEE